MAAAALGYALGFLPALMSATDDLRLVFGSIALVLVGGLLVPGVAAGLIAASPDGRRRIGLAALIAAVTTAIILCVLSADMSFTDAMPVPLLLTLVTIGALVGYSIGSRDRVQDSADEESPTVGSLQARVGWWDWGAGRPRCVASGGARAIAARYADGQHHPRHRCEACD